MNGYRQKYQSMQVDGASPLELVLLTYDVLIKSLGLAHLAGKEGDLSAEADHLSRAVEALVELSTSLDMEAGGEISSNLLNLYGYMTRRIMEGSASDTAAMIEELLPLANTLREGWQGIADANSRTAPKRVAGGGY